MEMSPWLAVCLPATPDDERDLRLRTFIRPNGMEATTLIGTRVMEPIGENSGRPSAAQLERLGVYDLAARQEAFARSRKRCEVDL